MSIELNGCDVDLDVASPRRYSLVNLLVWFGADVVEHDVDYSSINFSIFLDTREVASEGAE